MGLFLYRVIIFYFIPLFPILSIRSNERTFVFPKLWTSIHIIPTAFDHTVKSYSTRLILGDYIFVG